MMTGNTKYYLIWRTIRIARDFIPVFQYLNDFRLSIFIHLTSRLQYNTYIYLDIVGFGNNLSIAYTNLPPCKFYTTFIRGV